MALYHLSVKAVSRSAGRSATAAAAYRSGCLINDMRTGEVHDYRRKRGVVSADLVLPPDAPGWASDRAAIWNAAEAAERRKDACVAREYEVALPAELSAEARRELALAFAQDMATREGCAVDVAIHEPGREGDQRNHHAHILRTTRRVDAQGLGAKLDTEKAGRNRAADLEAVRASWADFTNTALRQHGIAAVVDHRSLAAQGETRTPTTHLGPAASGYERRTGLESRRRQDHQEEALARLAQAREEGELARAAQGVEKSLLDLSGDLSAAVAQRERPAVREDVAAGMAAFEARFNRFQGEEKVRQVTQQEALRQAQVQAFAEEQARKEAEAAADRERRAEEKKKRRERGGPDFSL